MAVATGSDAFIPDIPGLHAAKPWTSREATSAKVIPTSLAIIGGGVVGTEMATAYASFGCQVTLISRTGLLAGMEPFAGEMVAKSLQQQGVTALLDTTTTPVERVSSGVAITTGDGSVITADEILVATGRVPRTQDIGLKAIGLTPGEWILTDDTLLVPGFTWLYAVGDVNHQALLTHQWKSGPRSW